MKSGSVDAKYNKYSYNHKTEHYDFLCSKGSYAYAHIAEIAKYQETCYTKITSALNIFPDFKIKYLLADTPHDLGIIYGDNEPCNGFARLPNEIFAVYNEHIKCIGMHEDAHIISFSIKKPECNFIIEGLAMYFDGQWQGRDNTKICKQLAEVNKLPNTAALTDNNNFLNSDENISYPVAGAFTKFLVERLSMEQYLNKIYYNDDFYIEIAEIFGNYENANKQFKEWLLRQ